MRCYLCHWPWCLFVGDAYLSVQSQLISSLYHFRIVSSPEVLRFVKELNAKQEETELCRQCKLAQQASAEEQPINEEPSPDLQSLKSDNESLNHQCEEMRLELAILQSSSDSFHSDNAKLQVTVATLQSQISSLSTQHTALQLANSQLVAEKEEVIRLLSHKSKMGRGLNFVTSPFFWILVWVIGVQFLAASAYP